jgi:predicted RNA-binding protein
MVFIIKERMMCHSCMQSPKDPIYNGHQEDKSISHDQIIARIQHFSDYLRQCRESIEEQNLRDKVDNADEEVSKATEHLINAIQDDFENLFENLTTDRII